MKGVGGTFKARSRAMKILAEKKRRKKVREWTLKYLKESIESDMKIATQLKQGKLIT